MDRSFFSGVREIIDAFRSPEFQDQELQQALELVSADHERAAALGFRKPKKPKPTVIPPGALQPPGEAVTLQNTEGLERFLIEHGLNLSKEKFERLQSLLHLADERKDKRFRGFVQIAISILTLGAALLILALAKPNADIQKALWALIGTVVGYWLK